MTIKQIEIEKAKMELIHHNQAQMRIQILIREIKDYGRVVVSRDQLWLREEQTLKIKYHQRSHKPKSSLIRDIILIDQR